MAEKIILHCDLFQHLSSLLPGNHHFLDWGETYQRMKLCVEGCFSRGYYTGFWGFAHHPWKQLCWADCYCTCSSGEMGPPRHTDSRFQSAVQRLAEWPSMWFQERNVQKGRGRSWGHRKSRNVFFGGDLEKMSLWLWRRRRRRRIATELRQDSWQVAGLPEGSVKAQYSEVTCSVAECGNRKQQNYLPRSVITGITDCDNCRCSQKQWPGNKHGAREHRGRRPVLSAMVEEYVFNKFAKNVHHAEWNQPEEWDRHRLICLWGVQRTIEGNINQQSW